MDGSFLIWSLVLCIVCSIIVALSRADKNLAVSRIKCLEEERKQFIKQKKVFNKQKKGFNKHILSLTEIRKEAPFECCFNCSHYTMLHSWSGKCFFNPDFTYKCDYDHCGQFKSRHKNK